MPNCPKCGGSLIGNGDKAICESCGFETSLEQQREYERRQRERRRG